MATRLDDRPDQDSDNKVQDHYDQQFNELTSPEHMAKNADEPNLYDKENKPDEDDSAPLNGKQQAEADNKNQGDKDQGLYQPGSGHGGQSSSSRFKAAFSGKKKVGWIGGGIAGMVVAGFLAFFPVLGPLHIFNNLFDHNFEFNDSYRRNRTTRIIKSIFNANDSGRQLSDTPFKLKADLVEFEKFEARMNSRGWQLEYADPETKLKPTGLIKPDGTRANFDDPDVNVRAEIDGLVKDTVPAWRMNKRVRTRSLISTFTGPRRSFSWSALLKRNKTAEPSFEAAKFKKRSGIDDINIDGQVRIRDARTEDGGSISDKAMQATVDAKLDGATDAEAIAAGVTEAKNAATPDGGRTSLIIGSLVLGCIAHSVHSNELAVKFERYASALRYGATFMLAVNEMQQGGDIDIGEVGQLFKDFNNYESTTITTNDLNEITESDGSITYEETGEEVSLQYDNNNGTFAEAAAWQRATGADVSGEELNDEYRVRQTSDSSFDMVNGILGVLGSIGAGLAGIPGFGLLCSAIQSTVGFIVGIIFDFVEAATAVIACATGAGCILLGKFAIVELLWEVGSRMISAAMTGFAGFLTDNPVQSLAILDQSLNLTASEESRTAAPVSSEEYNAQVAAFKQERNQNHTFAERYFDMNNAHSLMASLANFKLSVLNADKNPSSLLASLLSLPSKSLAGLVNSNNVYAQADLDFDNYGFQKYSFNNEFLDVDPFTNAEEVVGLIEADDSIFLDSDNGNYARDFAVMCMGYNLGSGEVDKSDSNRSFLPMFSDPEGFPNAKARNEAFERVCIEEANSDPGLYGRIGRFVDDLELIQSMQEMSALIN